MPPAQKPTATVPAQELYKKLRPADWSEVRGQPAAVALLGAMVRDRNVPHALLFCGPSGCGKTTLARILRRKIGCHDAGFYEINSADFRGIDSIRDIRQRMYVAPLSGRCHVWLIDEAHQLTKDAQSSFLKMLEDTPKHVYFMLATTDPAKLLPTIRSRCTEVKLGLVQANEMMGLLRETCTTEGLDVDTPVLEKIVEVAEGGARKAMVMLEQVAMFPEAQRMAAVERFDHKQEGIAIARALFDSKTNWKAIAALLKTCEEEPETVRYIVLGYASAILLNSGNPYAATVINEFGTNFYDSKKAGLVSACYHAIQQRK